MAIVHASTKSVAIINVKNKFANNGIVIGFVSAKLCITIAYLLLVVLTVLERECE